MLWGQFEKEKEYLEKQYQQDHWDAASGSDFVILQTECRSIAADESKSIAARRAEMVAEVLTKAQIEINPYDWFQDKINHGRIVAEIENAWLSEALSERSDELKEKAGAPRERCAFTADHDFGHCIPDWRRILTYGLPGLKKLADERLAELEESVEQEEPADPEESAEQKEPVKLEDNLAEHAQREFYLACSVTANAMMQLAERLAAAAEQVSGQYEKQRYVACSLRNLSKKAPANTLEAMQLILLYYEMQTFVEGTLIRSLGNLDALLYPFYRRDLDEETFTEEQIRELLDYFMYKLMAKNVTANVPVCIGAADKDYAPNEFSYIFLEEYGRLGIYDPKIHIRYNAHTPDKLLKIVLDNIRKGHNSYVFLNDDVISAGLENIGMEKSESRDYAIVGCYEPCINGKEVPCSCNGRINLAKALEAVLNHGADMETGENIGINTGELSDLTTYEVFYEAVKKQIAYYAGAAMELITDVEKRYPQIHTAPLLSMSLESCMEKGIDAYEGGAKYNNSSINAFSIADIVDSLEVIRYLVYEEKELTICELADIIRNNWEGQEKLRLRCKRDFPKYGNGNAEADALAADIMSYTAALINGKPNGRGGVYRFGAFSIDWRLPFGEKTCALPSGRKAGEPLAKNIAAVAGQDKCGVTAMIQSATSMDFKQIPNGTVLDVALHNTAVAGEEGMTAMLGLLKTYMHQGGIAIQFNVLDEATLLAAQKEPEKYKNLQVRLCGWNVYYVNLNKKEQDDLIKQCTGGKLL